MLHHLDMSLVLCTSVPVPKIKVFSSKPLVLLIWMAGLVPVDVSTRVTVAPAIYYNLKRCGGNTFGTGFRRTGRIMPLDMLLSTAISISLSFLARIIPGLKRFHPILLVIYAVRNNSSIKDTFTIDPALQIPLNFLAPLSESETEEDRKNLKLLTRNGPINVDIYLLTKDQGITSKKPTTIDITVYNGQLSARLVCTTSVSQQQLH